MTFGSALGSHVEPHLYGIHTTCRLLREFGTRDVRYANYRVSLVGETTIRFLSILIQESILFYPLFT